MHYSKPIVLCIGSRSLDRNAHPSIHKVGRPQRILLTSRYSDSTFKYSWAYATSQIA